MYYQMDNSIEDIKKCKFCKNRINIILLYFCSVNVHRFDLLLWLYFFNGKNGSCSSCDLPRFLGFCELLQFLGLQFLTHF